MSELYPLLFDPLYKHYPWGGDRILKTYGRSAAPGKYAESWEVADRPDGMSVVSNGRLAGTPLGALVSAWGRDLLGSEAPANGPFPLLLKILDARETLSVQVHPDEAGAARLGGEPKTELWYLLGDAPGACVYAGFKEDFDRNDFLHVVRTGAVADSLQRLPVRTGDAVFMPGGRVHSIGAGCLLYEIQQNSNTTYRIFDWGRMGDDGRPRDLHLSEAEQVIDWTPAPAGLTSPTPLPARPGMERVLVQAGPCFRLEKWCLNTSWEEVLDQRSFRILFVVAGNLRLQWGEQGVLSLSAGTTVLVPAALSAFRAEAMAGACELLAVSL